MLKDFFSSKPQQISESALKIGKKIYGELDDIKVLVVGENKISFSILRYFQKNDILEYSLLTNEKEKKMFLADIFKYFIDFDIVLTSFKTDKILIKREQIVDALKKRKQKPLFLIDTNIPGNIDSDISKIDNCFLYDLNDLEQFYNDIHIKSEINSLPTTNDDFEDKIDGLIPKITKELNLDIEQNYILEEKTKFFFKRNSNITEKLGILNFFEFLIKK
tara:strand:- start:123 stop:779 length:657 start_codon:yes stop_codon:yes gene_type:complete